MAKKIIKCLYCGEHFDRNDETIKTIQIGRRYAHLECYEKHKENKTQEEKDKEALEAYILKLFNEEKINIKIRKQIKKFIEELNYTYSGILKALIYHYEIKKGDISKANGGIAIVEWVYQDAFNYYYDLWLANQRNEHKLIERYIPQVEEIKIITPKRKEKKRKIFSFLDKEE